MKIIAIILFLVGAVLIGIALAGYFMSEDQARCFRMRSEATAKLTEAMAVKGTPREAELLEDSRAWSDRADFTCRQASNTRQQTMWVGLGGLVLIIVSITLLIISRKRAV